MPFPTKLLPSWQGVAAGQTATLNLPIGLTYHKILINHSGVTLANITEMRVMVNGKAEQVYRGADQLDTINQFDGRAADAGVLILDFERYKLITAENRQVTAIGTGDPQDPTPINTFALELDIAAAAVAPALSAKAIQSPPTPLGWFKKVRHFNYAPTSAGDFEISDLPKGDLINRVFFFGGGNISKVQLKRNNYDEFTRDVAENSLIQTDGIRVPQANLFVYDTTEEGLGSNTLATQGVNDLRFTLTMAAAGPVEVVVEYVGPLGSM